MSGRPHNRLDLVGKRFARLVVLADAGRITHPCGSSHSIWLCRCDCGTETKVYGSALKNGNTKSCGCLLIDVATNRVRSHGKTGTPTYRCWQAMLSRCRNSNAACYANYGGRGISVCGRWLRFENFAADMGAHPGLGYSIERINNDGNYEPGNCRWASRREQNRNKRTNVVLTLNGTTKLLKDWATDLGIDQASLRERLNKWPLERALTQPKHGASNANT